MDAASSTEAGGGGKKAYIYAVAGRNRGLTLGTCERMSIETGVWEWCPMLKRQRGSHGAAAVNGVVYAVAGGGMNSEGGNLSSCEAYDGTGDWREVAPLASARHALAVAQGNDHIYAVGGWANGNTFSGECERFDSATGEWTMCASMNTPRRLHGAAVAHDGRLYVFGGASKDKFFINDAECYSPTTNEWHRVQQLPEMCNASAVTCGDHVYVFQWGMYMVRYCPSTDVYERLPDPPLKEWYGLCLAALGKDIYALGGVSQGKWKGWAFRYDTEVRTWTELPVMQAVRRRSAAVAVIH